MIAKKESLTYKKIFFFWIPLAATWLMMAIEGPFLAAIIARLANPKFNLAAYGVAFSFAVFIEAPIIMIMSASTALAKRQGFIHQIKKLHLCFKRHYHTRLAYFYNPAHLLLHHPTSYRIT